MAKRKVALSEKDRQKMERVRKEFAKDLPEIVRVVAATLGFYPEFPARVSLSISMDHLSPESPTSPDEITVVCDVGFPDGTKACYMDPPGICCEGPCPC